VQTLAFAAMIARRVPAKKAVATKRTRAEAPAKKRASASVEAADPRFEPVAKALARIPGFALMESKSKAMRGMMLNGKSFGMSSHGRFILKLDEPRVAALIAEGVGKPFGHGSRTVKGWIEVTAPGADWVALAKEAQRMAASAAKKRAR
jgi:hypothetical protein